MKILIKLLFFLPLMVCAEELPPLRVAITMMTAPFVMQSSQQEYYGFDIAMMNFVCKTLQRRCIYLPMTLRDIYPAIFNKKIDLAVGTILISADKLKYVALSMPYMLSYGQYIGTSRLATYPFNQQTLNNKRIGIIDRGTTFQTYVQSLHLENSQIITLNSDDEIVAAIRMGRIDLGLVDSHVVQYWQNNSAGELHAVGEPFPVGNGLGIMANLESQRLIEEINDALMKYQASGQFKHDYQLYLENF